MKIEFANDEVLIRHAVGQVKNNRDYSFKGVNTENKMSLPRAEPEGLYDENIFGLPLKCKCGSTTLGKCPICRIQAWDEKTYLNNYAYYQMNHWIVTDMKLHSLMLKLKELGVTPKLRTRYSLEDLYSTLFLLEPYEPGSQLKSNEVVIDGPNGAEKLVWTELPDYTDVETRCDPNNVGPYGLIRLADDYRINGRSLKFIKDHINSVLPITSPGLRKAKFPLIGGKITKQFPPINFEYRAIIEMDQRYAVGNEDLRHMHIVDMATVLFLFNKLYNVHVENSTFYKGGKEGLVRKSLQSRIGASIRWNVVNDHRLKINEIKVPRSAAYHALQSQIITQLKEDDEFSGGEGTTFDAKRLYINQDPRAIKVFENIIDNCVCVLGRNPSLHRNNLLAFKPILWDEPCICVNSYVCKSYNLDFDGDQMHCYFITDDFEKFLLGKRMNAENLWIFDKDNSPTYQPEKICLWGLYCASRIKESPKPKVFATVDDIIKAFNADNIQVDEQIILMPDKYTTYGREMLSKILKTDIENILGDKSTLDAQKLVRILAGLMDRPDRLDIMRDLDLFGNEIATIIGIDVLPLQDLYKNMSPEVDKLLNDKTIPEDVKLSKITEMMPKLLKKQLDALPDSNVDILLSGSRIKPSALLNLYTPYIRLDSKGKIKVGDSALIEGLSEEEYLEAAHTQRDILLVKAEAVPRAGFSSTQLVLPALDLKYSIEEGKEKSYVFVLKGHGTKDFTKGRIELPNIHSVYPGYAAIRSSATNNSHTVYKDEVSEITAKQLNNGARIGAVYGKAITEHMYQASLGLKYGGLPNDYNREDIRALEDGEVEEITSEYIKISGLKYQLSKFVVPTDEVLNRKPIKKGMKIAINVCLVNIKFRFASFDTLMDMKTITDPEHMYEFSEFRVPKGISYAPIAGRIHYEDNKVYIDGKLMGERNPKVTYFYPEGWFVNYCDRISSEVIDVPKMLQYISKEYAFWPFYLDLNRVAFTSNPENDYGKSLSLVLGEIIYKVMVNISFSIQKGLVNNPDFMTRIFYGATKEGLKTAADNSTTENMETVINVNEDNPLVRILLRQY